MSRQSMRPRHKQSRTFGSRPLQVIMDARVKFTAGPAEGRARLPGHDAEARCGAVVHTRAAVL